MGTDIGSRRTRAAAPSRSPRAPLGTGERFAALKGKLAQRPGVTSPGGLAAYIGRKKLGKGRFQQLAAKGKPGY